MSQKISRVVDLSRASITMTYDPEAINDECVFIDHSGPLFLTLDDAHKLYAAYADFFAMCRSTPQRPRPQLPGDFTVTPKANGDFEVAAS